MRATEVVYSPDRVAYLQRRVARRARCKSERITWDDDYNLLAEGLTRIADRYGPEALCLNTERGNLVLGLSEGFAPAGTSIALATGRGRALPEWFELHRS